MKELIEKYAALKLVIKEAEAEIKAIQPELKEQMDLDVKYEIEGATITLASGKVKWVYTEATTLIEEELKKTKKEEEQLGIATETRGEPFLLCTFPKVK